MLPADGVHGVHGHGLSIRRCTFSSPHRQHHSSGLPGPAQPLPTVHRVPPSQLQTAQDCIESRRVPPFICEGLLIARRVSHVAECSH
jgi:hypothetical protein